ncbi:MAG: energy transducer TonB, partial [Myxococcota bacterium]
AALFALGGSAILGTALVVMNSKTHRARETQQSRDADIQVREKKKEPPKKSVPKPKPKPRRARPNPAPRPSFGSQLSGLGGGIPVFSSGDLAGLTGDVMSGVDATKDLIHDAGSVDSQPDCKGQQLPTPPSRAIKRGITGYVKARALMGPDGRLSSVRIVESEPEGVFDDAVIIAMSSWVCNPATYGGQSVSMQYEANFPFR